MQANVVGQRHVFNNFHPTIGNRKPNISLNERAVSAAAAGALILAATRLERTACIGTALAGTALLYRAVSGYCHLYAAMGTKPSASRRIERAEVLVAIDSAEAYRFCRNPNNLATFISPLRHVDAFEATATERLDVWLTEDLPGRRLQWRSHPALPFKVELNLEFLGVVGDRGTAIAASWSADGINLAPSPLAAALASYDLKAALSKIKQLIETGEVANSRDLHQGNSSQP